MRRGQARISKEKLPAIDPAAPAFVLVLGTLEIHGKVNPKVARHQGGAVLQAKLVAEGGKLNLLDVGFTWIDPGAWVSSRPGGLPLKQSNVHHR